MSNHIKDNFFKVPNHLLQLGLNPYELSCMIVLYRYAGENGTCFPSLKTIQTKMNCCKNTVLKSLRSLEEKDLIIKMNRKSTSGDVSNLYRVHDMNPQFIKCTPQFTSCTLPSSCDEHNKEIYKELLIKDKLIPSYPKDFWDWITRKKPPN